MNYLLLFDTRFSSSPIDMVGVVLICSEGRTEQVGGSDPARGSPVVHPSAIGLQRSLSPYFYLV